MRPLAARAMIAIERTRVSQVTPESPGIPRAMVLTVSFALSLVTGLSCHHRPRSLPANLTPASGRQDHTTSPSAGRRIRQSAARVHRIPPRVRDDREPPLRWDETARDMQLIWVGRERKNFCKGDWTAQITLIRFSKTAFPRNPGRWPETAMSDDIREQSGFTRGSSDLTA